MATQGIINGAIKKLRPPQPLQPLGGTDAQKQEAAAAAPAPVAPAPTAAERAQTLANNTSMGILPSAPGTAPLPDMSGIYQPPSAPADVQKMEATGGIVAPKNMQSAAPTVDATPPEPQPDATNPAGRPPQSQPFGTTPLPTDAPAATNPAARPDGQVFQPSGVVPPDVTNPVYRPTDPTGTAAPAPIQPPVNTAPSTTPGGYRPPTVADAERINRENADKPLWQPTTGIVDSIRKADVQNVESVGYTAATQAPTQTAGATGYDATGYTAEKAPDAVGYNAEGYTADQVGENVSQAAGRIVSDDSVLMQRARAQADQQANARGIINSTMAIQAGQAAVLDKATELAYGDVETAKFNVAQKNDASRFLAEAKNLSAQFLAAEKNQNGRFNAEQANQAAAFSANAKNQASSFLAAAQNAASIFNAGEANKAAMFAVEQTNLALRFAAEAENAARSQNAQAFNQASQRYTDALNAAIAAQNDAENLARRDTAQIKAEQGMNSERVAGSIAAAGIGASASIQNAQLSASVRMKELEQQAAQFGVQMTQREREFAANLGAQQFNVYQAGLQNIFLADLEPEDKFNAINNHNAVWIASGGLPFDIAADALPPINQPANP